MQCATGRATGSVKSSKLNSCKFKSDTKDVLFHESSSVILTVSSPKELQNRDASLEATKVQKDPLERKKLSCMKSDACVTKCSSVVMSDGGIHAPLSEIKERILDLHGSFAPSGDPRQRGRDSSRVLKRRVVGSTSGCALADTAAKTPPGRQGLANILAGAVRVTSPGLKTIVAPFENLTAAKNNAIRKPETIEDS
ncbi:hypothetical protein G5I_00657 [Acromyrmex echinatior]|uniref:Uncharacterized protein n=1 Tax=Acromyrmex echinatior TaxID=103372 RepID=F4W5G0_ACREC|nr:hypothetical protein G5I_00657 [Acromyrmex echinatior]